MAEVKILYFGMLKEMVGSREEKLEVDASMVALDLVPKLAQLHGKRFEEFVLDSNGKTRPGLAFAVNGDTVEVAQLRKMKCKQVKEFAILPPISGG